MISEFKENILRRKPTWLNKSRGLVITGALALIVIVGVFLIIGDDTSSISSDNQPSVDIQRSYVVVARTEEKQRTTGRFNLTVTKARFADSILVQGKRAKPIKGKLFLVLDMEIENPHKVQLYAFPVDLFRFIRGDGQKFAPSVHQGTVLVRPEATKKSNIAFVIFPNEKNFKIEVGEVGEDKEILEISF